MCLLYYSENEETMNTLTDLIKSDMIPAFGVTEPGAVAFAVASARERTRGEIQMVKVILNKGIYKNAYTCGIPNSDHCGNIYAAALGAVAADSKLGLESLSNVTDIDNILAESMIKEGKVKVEHNEIVSDIYIDAYVKTASDECEVLIRESHINIEEIRLNGEVIFDNISRTGDKGKKRTKEIIEFSFDQLLEYSLTVPIEEISFINAAFEMNMKLFEEGMNSEKTCILKYLLSKNDNRVISKDFRNTAQLLCNGAIEARVIGLSKPAMSITGSGSHGIICTMPLLAYMKTHKDICSEDMLLRGTVLSYLITMYIKEHSGKLSAFCGCGIAAGTGMACGLALMMDVDKSKLSMVIRNMASGITGMICDGGNQGCTMKGIVAVDTAVQAVDMVMSGVSIEPVHGINGWTPEETMKNMGRIASPGMTATEDTIIDIMETKGI